MDDLCMAPCPDRTFWPMELRCDAECVAGVEGHGGPHLCPHGHPAYEGGA